MKCNAKLRRNKFSVNVSVLAVVFRRQFSKNRISGKTVRFFSTCLRNTTASTETFTEK